jgi:hypothetical protein
VKPIALSPNAYRALFRSTELVRAWSRFLDLNEKASEGGGTYGRVILSSDEEANLSPEQKWQIQHRAEVETNRDIAREAPIRDASNRAELRSLRAKIEQLIKKYGGPWQPDEEPHG